MRVLFDAIWWDDGPVSNRQVVRETILEWVAQFPQDEIHVVVPRSVLEAARKNLPDTVVVHRARISQHGLFCMIEMPIVARRIGADVILNQNFSTLWGDRSYTFIHDVLFESDPEWFTRMEQFYLRFITLSMSRSRGIFTSSSAEAAKISELHPSSRVQAVGLAVGTELAGSEEDRPRFKISPGKYVLAVGRLNVRKNLEYGLQVVLEAGIANSECPVVVVGSADGKQGKMDSIQHFIESGRVIFTGHVSSQNLVWLYKNALCLVFPTRGEGFGLPPIEAMSMGRPAIVSDIEVMREVTGGCAFFFPLDDLRGAVASVSHLSTDDFDRMGRMGRNHVQRTYAWSKTVASLRSTMFSEGARG